MERSDSQKSHKAWQSPPCFEDAEMIHSSSCSRASGGERQLDGVTGWHSFLSAGRSSARSRGRAGTKRAMSPCLEGKCRVAQGELGPRAQLALLRTRDAPHEQTAKSRLAGGKSSAAQWDPTRWQGGCATHHLQHPQGMCPSSEQGLLGWERNAPPLSLLLGFREPLQGQRGGSPPPCTPAGHGYRSLR